MRAPVALAALACVLALALPRCAAGAAGRFHLERTLDGTHYTSEWVERTSGHLDIEEDAADGARFRTMHVSLGPNGAVTRIEGKVYSPFASGSPPLAEYQAELSDRHVRRTMVEHPLLPGQGSDSTTTSDIELGEHDVFLPLDSAGLDEYLRGHPIARGAAIDLRWIDGCVGPYPVSITRDENNHVLVDVEGTEHHDYVLGDDGRILSGTVCQHMGPVNPTLVVSRKAWIEPTARPAYYQQKRGAPRTGARGGTPTGR